jgi:hypothetical protein
MSLADGDPACETDVWHRIITDRKYWKADGTLHNRAFTGRVIAPPTVTRPWSHELSGRLLSLVKNLEQESRDYCEQRSRQFHGVMFQNVKGLRSTIDEQFPTDVRYTPIVPDDPTHSDFVASDTKTDEDVHSIRDWLQSNLKAVKTPRPITRSFGCIEA